MWAGIEDNWGTNAAINLQWNKVYIKKVME